MVTTYDIRNAFGQLDRVQLSRWEKRGLLVRVRRGQYILAAKQDQVDVELLVNEIKNCYISLEYALNYYNLIPEVPRKITAVTTARSETVETPFGDFVYKKIKPVLFTGYVLKDSKVEGRQIKIASLTKSVFDVVYFGSFGAVPDFEKLRLNFEELQAGFAERDYLKWLNQVSAVRLKRKLELFLEFLVSH